MSKKLNYENFQLNAGDASSVILRVVEEQMIMDYPTYQYNPELAYPVEDAEEEARRGRSRSRTPPRAAEEVRAEEELPQDDSVPSATPARVEGAPLRRGRGRQGYIEHYTRRLGSSLHWKLNM